MRKLLMTVLVVAGASGAQAADMPDYPLRGGYSNTGPGRPMWDGFYIGGQAGESWLKTITPNGFNADIQAAYATRAGLNPGFPGLPVAETHNTSFGGFAGYNSQFEDVVISIEANYLHSSIAANAIAYTSASSPLQGRSNVNVALKDFGSARLRGGYMIGSFLPYAFVGVGAGSAEITRSVGVTTNAGVPVAFPFETDRKDRISFGYSAGLGLDVLLIGGLFARVEYEYTRFTSKIDTSVNSVRAGLGYKF